MPSLTREEGMKVGLWPALVQWKFPLGQAAVPGWQKKDYEHFANKGYKHNPSLAKIYEVH